MTPRIFLDETVEKDLLSPYVLRVCHICQLNGEKHGVLARLMERNLQATVDGLYKQLWNVLITPGLSLMVVCFRWGGKTPQKLLD